MGHGRHGWLRGTPRRQARCRPLAQAVQRAAHGTAPSHPWLSNLLDAEKWRDVLLMPYSAIDSIQPGIAGLSTLAALHLALMLAGALLGIAYAIRCVWLI